ncbi:hypothetical protein KIN20_018982 [Parelaphostrongylus tenuis]|uniref:Uncharacterized protein n=1 Tax=Parelaphostrongylus tenuis TaxID=148309 RepID=A0AAD5MQS3_PARTN|nr:hypothetical protein KIN20_018982 [Parelaphostrongylus tenuis]
MMKKCWSHSATKRPIMISIAKVLRNIAYTKIIPIVKKFSERIMAYKADKGMSKFQTKVPYSFEYRLHGSSVLSDYLI